MENTTLDVLGPEQHDRLAALEEVRKILGPDATSEQVQATAQFVLTGTSALDAGALDYAAQVLARELGYSLGDRGQRNKARGIATVTVTAYLTPAARRTPIHEITLAR